MGFCHADLGWVKPTFGVAARTLLPLIAKVFLFIFYL